ncbi:FadR family transcriptional regulator [Janibacter sp. YIM B02568]|uniref:FadR/GntR family transcriptional regulator n=1 Tax=Janibacter endophyticus TaxID=2806261 RepID=UPI00194FF3BA|nr:FadR/GntR family transcriptional regulator [Janibacter endophyticus]MBM6545425.1 FadR family transcriptional regulator [Janibacter endophyticus]
MPKKSITEPPRRSTIQLSPMAVPKASDVLADDLREKILSGEFPEGTALPPERELVVQTSMSRTTVREALRILEVQGLVRIKAGRSGGAFVQHPDENSMAASVGLLIRGRQIRIDNLLETREGLEPFTARLAARNRTDDDLTTLQALNEEIASATDLAAFLAANVEWHVAIAHASHNELLSGLLKALAPAIYSATENEDFINDEVMALTVRAHTSIIRAIRDQDEAAAERRMARHVHDYAVDVREHEHREQVEIES